VWPSLALHYVHHTHPSHKGESVGAHKGEFVEEKGPTLKLMQALQRLQLGLGLSHPLQ
jgi:hypothetical protein